LFLAVSLTVLPYGVVGPTVQLQRRYSLLVPTSLVSLSRAIAMLEGIALEANPEFNIVSDSFPFILGQLIQDPHPRVKGALRFMVYGPTGVFDMQRYAFQAHSSSPPATHPLSLRPRCRLPNPNPTLTLTPMLSWAA
jgi:hypothetical protein